MKDAKKALEKTVSGPSAFGAMEKLAKELQKTYQTKLKKTMDEEYSHSGGRAPFAGTPYDPL